jgi:hypothetical protein
MVQAVCPLPEIFRTLKVIRAKDQDPEVRKKHQDKLRAKISRSWIALTLNNAAIMWTYAFMRGDLADSFYGNIIGKT